MRNGSDDDPMRSGPFEGSFGAPPSVGVSASSDDAFALGELVAALRRPADLGPGVDAAVMDAIRLAPAPLVVVPGSATAPAGERRRALRDRRHPVALDTAAEPAPAPLPRAWRWFTSPRAVRVTPLGALAAAGIAIAAVFGLRREPSRRDAELGATPDPTTATGEFAAVPRDDAAPAAPATPAVGRARDTVYITRFVVAAPGAKQVTLVGDFNQWDHGATPLARATATSSSTGIWTVDLPLTAGRHSYAFLIDGQRWMADPSRPRAIGDDFGRPSSAVTVGGGEA